MKPHVITIGYGRHLFDPKNNERKRLELCAKETAALHQIIFTHRRDELTYTESSNQLHLHPTNSRSKLWMVFDAVRIARSLIKAQASLYIVTTQDPFAAGLVGVVLQKLYGVRLVAQEHGDVYGTTHWKRESFLNRVSYVLGRWVLRQADAVRVVARRVATHVQAVGVPRERITQLPVAIDVEQFVPKTHKNKVYSKQFTFVTVARLVSQKNVPLMLSAFRNAWEQNPNIRLHIVGSGPEEKNIKETIAWQYAGIVSPVTVQSWSDDVSEIMRTADAYLMTSNYEGWARVLIEAMVMHLPVVTTDVGCAHEVLKHGEHGLIVPTDDLLALTAAILSMSNDVEQYGRFVGALQVLRSIDIPGADLSTYGRRWVETLIT